MQDRWHSKWKHSKSECFGSIMSLADMTWPALTPHAQRMKSFAWFAAMVMYSASFSCSTSNSLAAAFTAGMSFVGSLVLASMMMLTSHGAAKNVANPRKVIAPVSAGVCTAFTSSSFEHWGDGVVRVWEALLVN